MNVVHCSLKSVRIYDAYILISVLSEANFNVPYLILWKCFSAEILRVV